MSTAADFIDLLGGTIKVAAALSAPPSTVSSWKQSDSIPRWRLDGLRMLALEAGVDVPTRFAAGDGKVAA